jgi:hypothetical protein
MGGGGGAGAAAPPPVCAGQAAMDTTAFSVAPLAWGRQIEVAVLSSLRSTGSPSSPHLNPGSPPVGGSRGRVAPPYQRRGRHHEVHEVEPSMRRLLLVAGAPPPVKPRRHPPCIFVAGKHTSELPSLHTLSSMLLFFLNGLLGNCGLLHHET